MHKLILLGLWMLLSPCAGAAAATFGQHGMVLFGGSGGLYASHLPMYHAPHDWQVILRLRLADPALDARLRRALASKVSLWTLSPEAFALDRLAPASAHALKSFQADVVQGHFEQGGQTRHAGARVMVEQVLVWRRLDPAAGRKVSARYLQIGHGRERFLVKQIDSRPDFDHIVAIRSGAGSPASALALPKPTLAQPSANALRRALPGAKI
ncbi:MAG TPA: hypothetical protein VGC21_19285, partial [Telluria sp.]